MPRKSVKPVNALVSLAEGQICQRCKRPIDSHRFTDLGAVVCLEIPGSPGLTSWKEHKFITPDGMPYVSIMEEIGVLAAVIEAQGRTEAYATAMGIIQRLVARLSACQLKEVKPYKRWFEKKKKAKRNKKQESFDDRHDI